MSVADMRKAGRYLHKMLTKKAPSQGAAPARNGVTEDEALRAVLRRIYIMGW